MKPLPFLAALVLISANTARAETPDADNRRAEAVCRLMRDVAPQAVAAHRQGLTLSAFATQLQPQIAQTGLDAQQQQELAALAHTLTQSAYRADWTEQQARVHGDFIYRQCSAVE